MAYILNIETATHVCSVGLSLDGEVRSMRESSERNIHASMTTLFIEEVLKEEAIRYADLSALAVSKGPGSYTGLRIGTSVAKGLCYSLDIPLIAVSTLQAMAYGASLTVDDDDCLFCPMIDARRMEVYAALFNSKNEQVREVKPEIIEKDSFSDNLKGHRVYFFGDGSEKSKEVLSGNANAFFLDDILPSARFMAPLAHRAYRQKDFADTAYFEPFYLKEFRPGIPRVKGLE